MIILTVEHYLLNVSSISYLAGDSPGKEWIWAPPAMFLIDTPILFLPLSSSGTLPKFFLYILSYDPLYSIASFSAQENSLPKIGVNGIETG